MMDRVSKMHSLAVVVFLCLMVAGSAQDTPVFRLPNTVLPQSYTVRLEPNLNTNTLNGIVIINLITAENTSEPINSITLHLGTDASLVENVASLVSMKGTIIQRLSFIYDDDAETVQITLQDGVVLDNNQMYVLTLKYQTPISTEVPLGVFAGSFSDNSKYMALNLRAMSARNVFPCFDEPQIQAPITLQVLRPTDYKTLSTALLASSDDVDNSTVLDTFAPTPAMAAGALGLFMSQLDPVSAMGVNVIVASGYNATSPWLGSVISDITGLLGEFPVVQTLNLVILPDLPAMSFSSYGFVYTTPEVFYDKITGFLNQKTLKTQATEALLHQWLAYSKTPAWWSDLWLTESMSAYLVNKFLPQVPVLDLDTVMLRSNALNYEGPVVAPLLTSQDVDNAIEQQTIKSKGLSVLNMWRDTLPEGVLDQTILNYVALSQKVTVTKDFLDLLENNIRANTTYNVTEAISELGSWLYAEGTPYLTTSIINGGFEIVQRVGCPGSSNDTTLWPVSISFTQNASQQWTNVRQGLWLIDWNLTIAAPQDSWTIFNLESAPYRNNYTYWSNILSAMSDANTPVPVAVRATLQDDAISLAIGGCLPWTQALLVLNSTQHAQADWLVVTKALDVISNLFGNDTMGMDAWQMYAKTVFPAHMFPLVDMRNSSSNPDQWYARSLVTPWLCKLGLGSCRDAVNALFQTALTSNSDVDPNDLDNVVCLGARYNPSVVDQLLVDYQNTTSFEMRRLFTIALGCLIDPTSVQTVLNNISKLSYLDTRKVLVSLASSPENSAAVQDYIVANADNILQNSMGSILLSDVIKVFGQFRTSIDKLEALLEDTTLDLGWSVKQSIAATSVRTQNNMAWFAFQGQALEQVLNVPATVAPPQPATSTMAPNTTGQPSSATSLMDLRVLTLVLSAAVSIVLRSL